jgi:hypothetical protein
VNFSDLYLLMNSISHVDSVGMKLYLMLPYYLLNICRLCRDTISLISYISNLCLYSFYLNQSG